MGVPVIAPLLRHGSFRRLDLAWDDILPGHQLVYCKPGGCEVTIKFGTAPAVRLIAVQHKSAPNLILQNAGSVVALARQQTGPIDIQVQTTLHGTVAVQFSTATRLQVERLNAPNR